MWVADVGGSSAVRGFGPDGKERGRITGPGDDGDERLLRWRRPPRCLHRHRRQHRGPGQGRQRLPHPGRRSRCRRDQGPRLTVAFAAREVRSSTPPPARSSATSPSTRPRATNPSAHHQAAGHKAAPGNRAVVAITVGPRPPSCATPRRASARRCRVRCAGRTLRGHRRPQPQTATGSPGRRAQRSRAEVLARRPVRTRQHLEAKPDLAAHGNVSEVEHAIETDVVLVEMARQESLDPDRLPLTEAPQLGNDARARAADVEDGEAAGRIEAATMQPGALAAERVVARAQVPPTFATERRQNRSSDASRVDLHAATRSRPPRSQGSTR